MMNSRTPTLADILAQTPGAQTRAEALASIAASEKSLAAPAPESPPEDFAAREDMPIVDNPETYATGLFARLLAKDKPPPRGSKPRLAVDNKTVKKKKPAKDDDPEPPKAA